MHTTLFALYFDGSANKLLKHFQCSIILFAQGEYDNSIDIYSTLRSSFWLRKLFRVTDEAKERNRRIAIC